MSDLLYRNSATWRTIVGATKASPIAFVGFSALVIGGCYIAADYVMNATNPNFKEEGYRRQEEELRKQPLDVQVRPLCTAAVHCRSCRRPAAARLCPACLYSAPAAAVRRQRLRAAGQPVG